MNLFEYPVWLITGLLVPLSLLPGWVSRSRGYRPDLGDQVDPRSGDRRRPGAASRRHGARIAYVGIGVLALRFFERLARQRATLALT